MPSEASNKELINLLFFEERQINLISSLSLIDHRSLPSTEQPRTLLGVISGGMDS
jgi:hypothetical protein